MITACGRNFWRKLIDEECTKLIAIVDGGWGVAKNREIPWSFEEDRRFFKELTQNSPVIMGRKTFESLSNKPLKNRINCVVSRSFDSAKNVLAIGNTEFFKSLEDALKNYKNSWIIGGSEIYNYALREHLVDHAIITKMHKSFGAELFIDGTVLESQLFSTKQILITEEKYTLFCYSKF